MNGYLILLSIQSIFVEISPLIFPSLNCFETNSGLFRDEKKKKLKKSKGFNIIYM
jgi:hypothetical protein